MELVWIVWFGGFFEVGCNAATISMLNLAIEFGACDWERLFETHVMEPGCHYEKAKKIEVIFLGIGDSDINWMIQKLENELETEDEMNIAFMIDFLRKLGM